jgi:hypothetical protein
MGDRHDVPRGVSRVRRLGVWRGDTRGGERRGKVVEPHGRHVRRQM